ncbi:MAG: spore germination protein [Christensenellaceae bacterium]|jgi:spore germination protein KB|nr:spore germination protein [Christensenellaceae bacterium]
MRLGASVKNIKISALQLILLAVGVALMLPYTFMPIIKSAETTRSLILTITLSIVYLLILDAPIIFLMKKHQGASAHEIFGSIAGSKFSKVISVVYILLFAFLLFSYALIVVQFLKTSIIPTVPTTVVLSAILVPAVYIVFKGGGVLARISVFFVPIMLFTILLFSIFGVPDMDIKRILPIVGSDSILSVNKAALIVATRVSEVLIIFSFANHLRKTQSTTKIYLITICMYSIFLVLMVLPTVLVLGQKYASMTLNPYYTYARQIKFYDSIERLHALSALAGFPCMILRLSTYGVMASKMFSNIALAKHTKVFTLAFFIVIFITLLLALSYGFFANTIIIDTNTYIVISIIAKCILPLVFVVIYLIKKALVKLTLLRR